MVRDGNDSAPWRVTAGPHRRKVAGRIHSEFAPEGTNPETRPGNDQPPARDCGRGVPVLTIADLTAFEILDSRGQPTVCVTAGLSNGVHASAHVPAGASTGKHEAVELRDGDSGRY